MFGRKKSKRRWRRWPYLDFWLDIWIIEIRTTLMHQAVERDVRDNIRMRIRFFKRWGFEFHLYSPYIMKGQP